MMRLRSTTLLSLGSQAIDLPSLGMQISHPMTELPPWPDVLSPICSSLLPRGAVHFPESTTTSLSRPSNSSPTAVAFAKARSEPSASPPMPTRTCRDRYKNEEVSTVSGVLVSADMATRNCRHEDIFRQGCASSSLDPLLALWRGALALGLFGLVILFAISHGLTKQFVAETTPTLRMCLAKY
ncbi:hypothetical protein M405DRAFT_532303 [Rhizopogon salebrosus TDB-379]|nr:hypothetical protein M405DRAFT_532303 [Rhizopogon salebrosus TDB-379]